MSTLLIISSKEAFKVVRHWWRNNNSKATKIRRFEVKPLTTILFTIRNIGKNQRFLSPSFSSSNKRWKDLDMWIGKVGLVIGKLSSALDRGFIFDLIPTPQNDNGEPACSLVDVVKDDKNKGSKSKSSSSSSSSSFLLRCSLIRNGSPNMLVRVNLIGIPNLLGVSRMLFGGMYVVGIYIWVNDNSFKNSTLVLCQTLKQVAEAAPIPETDWNERLVVHISYSPTRWTCRNCMLTSNITPSSLKPCDLKMGRVLSSLQKFRCIYNFDLRLPICHESKLNIKTLSGILCDGIIVHARELRAMKAIVDENLVVEDEPCTSDGLHNVELIMPFMKDAFIEACSQKDHSGVLVFRGSVCSFSCLNSKEPISQALVDIKGDIIRSLQSRLDIICDEAEGATDPEADGSGEVSTESSTSKPVSQLLLHNLRETCNLLFPRRVFIPWLSDTYVCDYLQPSETL
ncbi:ODR-4-like, partial [Dillenia turbinata]